MPLRVDPHIGTNAGKYIPEGVPSAFADAGYCGRSFEGGLLRFHDAASGPEFRELVHAAFPELADPRADVLAFDWQGRQIISVREKRSFGRWGDVELRVADLAAGKIFGLASVDEFAAVLKHDLAGATFGADYYERFREAFMAPDSVLAFDECVEYTHPLFLGGADGVENMAVTNIAVYWSVVGQVRAAQIQ